MKSLIHEWNDLIGHKHLINNIQRTLRDDNVPEVSLFYGQSGIGKSSIIKLLAIDLIIKYTSLSRTDLIKTIIDDDKSIEQIKIYNMSQIGEKQDEISVIKNELHLGFAGKIKVVILDECHNMSKQAQDAILTELEPIERGLYIMLASSEVGSLSDALVGRCTRYELKPFNSAEMSQLIRRHIQSHNLKFNMPLDIVVQFISYYAKNQARDAIRLLENWKDNATISNEDISIFINTGQAREIVKLIEYLYGSMVLGLNYIQTLTIDVTFADVLSDTLRVALGGIATSFNKDDIKSINYIVANNDILVLVKFVADVMSSSRITKRSITAAFIKNHKMLREIPVADVDSLNTRSSDMKTIIESQPSLPSTIGSSKAEREHVAPSFDSFFTSLQSVDK